MFASRIGPPTNAAYFDSVLSNTTWVKSMLLKHASHRAAPWMNAVQGCNLAHSFAPHTRLVWTAIST
jgi:hypothetical protein